MDSPLKFSKIHIKKNYMLSHFQCLILFANFCLQHRYGWLRGLGACYTYFLFAVFWFPCFKVGYFKLWYFLLFEQMHFAIGGNFQGQAFSPASKLLDIINTDAGQICEKMARKKTSNAKSILGLGFWCCKSHHQELKI